MLVTSLCWWLYDGDWFQMLVAESLYWRLFSLFWWVSQCIKSVTNILNRSPTSQTCHQHIWSPTSVANIDVIFGLDLESAQYWTNDKMLIVNPNFRAEAHFIEEYSKEAVPKSYNVILHIFNHRLPKLANSKFNGMKMINAL